MNSEIALLTKDIGLFLSSWAGQARASLTLVAPFIKRKALERLTQEVGPAVRLTVLTRWSVEEICAGVSDLDVFDLLRKRAGSRLLLHPRLHAKVMLVDDTAAVIGSANITDTALGFAEQVNAEVVATLRPVPNRLFLFLLQLEQECVPATDELRRQFEEAVKASPPPAGYQAVQIPEPRRQEPATPFPRFRIPEWLYRGYLSVVEFSDHETRGAILSDLETLSLPDGLDEGQFRERIGSALATVGIASAFDCVPACRGCQQAQPLLRAGVDFEDRHRSVRQVAESVGDRLHERSGEACILVAGER
jgi:hypothetical protein